MLNAIQKPLVRFADLTRLFERACSFVIQTAKIVLNIMKVEFEVLTNEVTILLRRFRIVWNEGSCRCNASLSTCPANQNKRQDYRPRKGKTAQPEVSCTPYFLD